MGDLMPTLGIPLNVSARSVFPIRFGSIAISSPSEPPTGCLTAPFEAQADGLSVQFRDTTSGSDGWLWRVGSFATYNTVNPTHDFPQEGTYPVTLTATVGSVDCNAYGPVDISVSLPPRPPPPRTRMRPPPPPGHRPDSHPHSDPSTESDMQRARAHREEAKCRCDRVGKQELHGAAGSCRWRPPRQQLDRELPEHHQ